MRCTHSSRIFVSPFDEYLSLGDRSGQANKHWKISTEKGDHVPNSLFYIPLIDDDDVWSKALRSTRRWASSFDELKMARPTP